FSPTLQRCLAVCASRKLGQHGPVTLDELLRVSDQDFDFLHLAGGFGVVTTDGAFLVDDWRSQPLGVKDLQNEFFLAARRLDAIERVAGKVAGILAEIGDRGGPGRGGSRSELNQLADLNRLKLDIDQEITATLPQSANAGVLRFREVVERR